MFMFNKWESEHLQCYTMDAETCKIHMGSNADFLEYPTIFYSEVVEFKLNKITKSV